MEAERAKRSEDECEEEEQQVGSCWQFSQNIYILRYDTKKLRISIDRL